MNEIINKITELNVNGYYDKSNGYVTVWFHNTAVDKSDIVAYLRHDMSWDVREVIDEFSTLHKQSEEITIEHNPLGIFEAGSQFDVLVKKILNEQFEQTDDSVEAVTKAKEILDRGSYNLSILS